MTVADVVAAADAYGDHGVLLTVLTPRDVPRVVAAIRAERGPTAAAPRPGWRSVLVPGDTDPQRVLLRLESVPMPAAAGEVGRLVEGFDVAAAELVGALITLPVHYDGADLREIAEHAGISVAEAIDLHASAEYTVVLLGFGSGFPYLAGLPERLHGVSRRATPRVSVPAGSVALVADMAGIYPTASPGGWALLGRLEATAPPLFTPSAQVPSPIPPGTRIRFEPVT